MLKSIMDQSISYVCFFKTVVTFHFCNANDAMRVKYFPTEFRGKFMVDICFPSFHARFIFLERIGNAKTIIATGTFSTKAPWLL